MINWLKVLEKLNKLINQNIMDLYTAMRCGYEVPGIILLQVYLNG